MRARPFFSVSDTGEGMSHAFIEERLFHPFATTKRRGVGLGLYTCREVWSANGGSIEVESKEGAGTTFRVVLPSAAIDKRGERKPHSHLTVNLFQTYQIAIQERARTRLRNRDGQNKPVYGKLQHQRDSTRR